MASKPPSRRIPASELRGQAKVIHEVRQLVDEWRAFELGVASDAYPQVSPRYEPVREGERALSPTSLALLHHWFRREPHFVGGSQLFRYWPHQRRLVETFVYLYEVRGVRRTEDLYQLAGVESLGPQRDPWTKLGGQLATGSGKTKMMSLIIAWTYLNAVCEGEGHLGVGRHSILIAPGLFVRDRLLQDFDPPSGKPPVFWADPVVPPEFESLWNLKVYSPDNCPRTLDPEEGALVVTNYHQLLRTSDESDLEPLPPWQQRQLDLLFEGKDPQKLEDVSAPLIERFSKSRGLLVLNDEAHHVWDEPGHAKFEQKAKEKAALTGEGAEAMAWIRSIRKLNGREDHPGRMAIQVDLSATLFEEQGSTAKGTKTQFKQAELFRHTSVHYGLAEAIGDGIVKKPILERVEVKNKKTQEAQALIRDGQPNAWEKYRNLLATGIERWKKVRAQLRDEGDPRKPILFILCDDKKEAQEVANYLSYGEAVHEDLSGRVPTGYKDTEDSEPLFVEKGKDGTSRSTVVEIHIGQKEQSNEAEWEKIRQSINAIDADEIPDPDGSVGDQGRPLMVPNPYNVVVSVMMLKEGWDVRNVKVIVPLRPCNSRTLTEQALGRGLRKMHPPVLDDDGGAKLQTEDLYVIEHPSFQAVIEQIREIIEEKSSDEIDHAREYVPILQEEDEEARTEVDVRLVKFQGMTQVQADWRKSFDIAKVPALTPKVPWMEEIPETEINTYLKKALEDAEKEGQQFFLPANPSYRDFDHVMEVAYAIPLLKELRTSYQHKTAVKGIVQDYLERKTFAIPMGVPLSFGQVIEQGMARIALANLARPEVIGPVRKALQPALHEALTAERPAMEAQLSDRKASELRSYQALKRHVLPNVKKSSFTSAAMDSQDELRVAALLEAAPDVVGWLFNHRSGVGYFIEYDWQGYTSRYFPDFIARAKIGEVFHNFIIEVKGRMDDRDKAKAKRGQRYCELLTEYDKEPWHYLFLLENPSDGRQDITWWEGLSAREIVHLLRHHEGLPLYPASQSKPPPEGAIVVLPDVPAPEKYQTAVPVIDLAVAAGGFSESQAPEPAGWARVRSARQLDKRMFLSLVVGHSMEAAVPDGSWGLFRLFPDGAAPSPLGLDGRRVLVQYRDEKDPETGGQYTLKRWKVTQTGPDGGVVEVELRPDNPSFKSRRFKAHDGDLRVVAEFLEVVG